MQTSHLICFVLLIVLYIDFAVNGSTGDPKRRRRRMRNNSSRKALGDRKTGRQHKAQPSPLPAPPAHAPLVLADDEDSFVDVFHSLIGLGEQESSYNVLPGKKGHCSSGGMIMYDKAVWSPKACVTCLCSNGKAICDQTTCPALKCLKTVTREGECCPICLDIVTVIRTMGDRPDFSGDSPEPNDPSEAELGPLPRTQTEKEEKLRQEGEERQATQTKDQLEKEKKEKKRERKEKERKELEARLKEEELERIKEENVRKANEEEEQRLEEEESKRREEEEKRKEADNRKREEEKRREKERQRPRAREEDDEEEEPDEEGDLFRNPLLVPGLDLPAVPAPLPAGCFITDVTVSCTYAKLRTIPAVYDLSIKSLELLGNSITSIPNEAFNGMPNLEWLNLGKNNLASLNIGPRAFEILKNLKRLYLDGNALVQVPQYLPSTVEELKLNDNNIQTIEEDTFQDLHQLVTLELEGNNLSESNVDPLAFKPLKHLSYLRLGRNKFRTIPQGLPTSIEELYLENNQIEEISEMCFNQTNNLNTIVLRHNRLEESRIAPLAWIYHENLESIDLSYNKFVHVPSYLPTSLVHLVLMGNQIERIPGYVFGHMKPGLEYLYLSFNKLASDGIDPVSFHGSYHSLRELFLDHNDLTEVPAGMEDMKALHSLRLNNNKIRAVPPHFICGTDEDDEDSKLEHLHLENNYIRTRDISPYAFTCITSYQSIILKPQYVK